MTNPRITPSAIKLFGKGRKKRKEEILLDNSEKSVDAQGSVDIVEESDTKVSVPPAPADVVKPSVSSKPAASPVLRRR